MQPNCFFISLQKLKIPIKYAATIIKRLFLMTFSRNLQKKWNNLKSLKFFEIHKQKIFLFVQLFKLYANFITSYNELLQRK